MAFKFIRVVALCLRFDRSVAPRNPWNECRRLCTCLKQELSKHVPRLSRPNSPIQSHKRYQQTLSANFGSKLPSVKQIEHFLLNRKLRFEHGHTSILASCPVCGNKKETKDLTLYINKTTGSHFCKGCSSSGSWQEFKAWCLQINSADSHSHHLEQQQSNPENQSERAIQIWEKSLPLSKCSGIEYEKVVNQFSIQGIKSDMLDKYHVRVAKLEFKEPNGQTKEQTRIVFPWYNVNRSLVKGVKLVKLDDSSDTSVTVEPRQGFLGLFGWNTVGLDAKEVVMTSTEFNAIAVHQSTSYPAISLPLGTNSLPPEVLPQLEQFQKIILWFGNDVISRQAANQFSRKLNLKRPTGDNIPSNALDALNMGCDLNSLISEARPISHEKITTFHQLRDEVLDQFVNADQVAGVKWTRFPKMNSILKGLRRGEVTVFTGPTGAGKTTLLSEMSLDLCMQGVNTLWGSFEIHNVRLVKMMLSQYSGLNLEKNVEQFQYWADKFEALPMYFMCFHGAQNISTVIETMSHAAYVYDIEHVIVDNLQFMTSYFSRGDDRFSAQNHVIAALRNFATTKNVHVTLVIHPRKENDDVQLQTASIFGTAKASQEADNVIILQNKSGTPEKYLQVTKNRFDGVLGRVPLEFVRESLSMSGFGKTSHQRPAMTLDRKRPDKLKATRLVTGAEVLKFSSPKLLGESTSVNKLSNRNSKWAKFSSMRNTTRREEALSEAKLNKRHGDRNSKASEADDSGPKVGGDFNNVMSTREKKEIVQKTVKQRLSGTRLFTKAMNASRGGHGTTKLGQVASEVKN